ECARFFGVPQDDKCGTSQRGLFSRRRLCIFPRTQMLPHIPDGVTPTWYFVCVGLAVLVTGISKGGFGGGTGILAIPLMSLVMGPRQMLGVMLPLLIACDVLSNLHYLGEYDWSRLRWLLPGAVVGIVIGTITLYAMRGMPLVEFNQLMNFIIGVI